MTQGGDEKGLRRVDRVYKTKGEFVYEQLREAVATGDLAPGQRIVLDQVAEALGVSKVPVREAITRLVGEGWVELHPHVGPVVPQLSPDEVVETAVIRASLEATAIALATSEMSADVLTYMRRLLRQMDHAVQHPSDDYAAFNRQFHSLAISTCPVQRLTRMVSAQIEQTARYQTVRRVPAYLEESQSEHRAILRALAGRDGDLAAKLTSEHILTAAYKLRERVILNEQKTQSRAGEPKPDPRP
jgi:DNA-binding GntR family transcriptional regulator